MTARPTGVPAPIRRPARFQSRRSRGRGVSSGKTPVGNAGTAHGRIGFQSQRGPRSGYLRRPEQEVAGGERNDDPADEDHHHHPGLQERSVRTGRGPERELLGDELEGVQVGDRRTERVDELVGLGGQFDADPVERPGEDVGDVHGREHRPLHVEQEVRADGGGHRPGPTRDGGRDADADRHVGAREQEREPEEASDEAEVDAREANQRDDDAHEDGADDSAVDDSQSREEFAGDDFGAGVGIAQQEADRSGFPLAGDGEIAGDDVHLTTHRAVRGEHRPFKPLTVNHTISGLRKR